MRTTCILLLEVEGSSMGGEYDINAGKVPAFCIESVIDVGTHVTTFL